MITRKEIERLISDLKNYMYPNYFDNKQISKSYIKKELNTIFKKTNIQDYPEDDFLNELENIKKELEKDIEAFYEGDPASTSKEEIIITPRNRKFNFKNNNNISRIFGNNDLQNCSCTIQNQNGHSSKNDD